MNYGTARCEEVISAACRMYGVKRSDMLGISRRRPLVKQRQAAMVACRLVTGFSYPSIAAVFDRDHTTVIFAVQSAAKDPSLMADAQEIAREVAPSLSPGYPPVVPLSFPSTSVVR